MGNSTSAGKRHNSGEDSGPNITARALYDSDSFDIASYKRPRAHTVSLSQGQTISPEITTIDKKLPTVFKWEGGGKEVFIAGSYDNWKGKIPMVKSQSDFYTIIDLPEGEYQYKFYVDGQWVHDQNEEVSKNHLGTENNIINVQKSDFEVFEALDIDSVTPTNSSSSSSTLVGSSRSLSGEYGQDIPSRRPNEKHAGPPFLPPHLLQVILNKDTPAHCEPTLLPEPNHVMLNHLYALSIKDGVMVLSATHRFKKKFVTTLLYKPT